MKARGRSRQISGLHPCKTSNSGTRTAHSSGELHYCVHTALQSKLSTRNEFLLCHRAPPNPCQFPNHSIDRITYVTMYDEDRPRYRYRSRSRDREYERGGAGSSGNSNSNTNHRRSSRSPSRRRDREDDDNSHDYYRSRKGKPTSSRG